MRKTGLNMRLFVPRMYLGTREFVRRTMASFLTLTLEQSVQPAKPSNALQNLRFLLMETTLYILVKMGANQLSLSAVRAS